jgi:hypothetical protein
MYHPMRRLVKNTLLVFLWALLGSRADATSIRETTPLPLASDKTRIVQNVGHAKEGTEESYTQGGIPRRFTNSHHHPSSLSAYRFPQIMMSFLFISICKKTPSALRTTTRRSATRHHPSHNLLRIAPSVLESRKLDSTELRVLRLSSL